MENESELPAAGRSSSGPRASPGSASPASVDPALIEAVEQGDSTVYERMVRRHAGRMLAVIRRILHDEEASRDALQEAFRLALRALTSFQDEACRGTRLRRIAVNAALMHRRRRLARPEIAIEKALPAFDETGHAVHPVAPTFPDGESVRLDEEARRRVRDAIAQLLEPYRAVMMLRHLDELGTAETAALLGLTEGAVATRLHRARQALITLLQAGPR